MTSASKLKYRTHALPPDRTLVLGDGTRVILRPLRPEDDQLYPEFDGHLTDEDRRLRFLVALRHIPQSQIFRLTHFDREHARAYAAIHSSTGQLLGVGRIHRISPADGEFAVLVRSDLKGRGLGRALMDLVLAGGRELGIQAVLGLILRENVNMIALCRELGFTFSGSSDPNLVEARLALA